MKEKWSPGPWRLGDDATGKPLTVWAAQPGICITSVFDNSLGDDVPSLATARHNARLISAAPELYATLKLVLRIGPRPWIPGKPRVSFEEWDAAIEAAERALSRAADQRPEVFDKRAAGPSSDARKVARRRVQEFTAWVRSESGIDFWEECDAESVLENILTEALDTFLQEGVAHLEAEWAENAKARESAELIMRDNARRANDHETAKMHADRAQAFHEMEMALRRGEAEFGVLDLLQAPSAENALPHD